MEISIKIFLGFDTIRPYGKKIESNESIPTKRTIPGRLDKLAIITRFKTSC